MSCAFSFTLLSVQKILLLCAARVRARECSRSPCRRRRYPPLHSHCHSRSLPRVPSCARMYVAARVARRLETTWETTTNSERDAPRNFSFHRLPYVATRYVIWSHTNSRCFSSSPIFFLPRFFLRVYVASVLFSLFCFFDEL